MMLRIPMMTWRDLDGSSRIQWTRLNTVDLTPSITSEPLIDDKETD